MRKGFGRGLCGEDEEYTNPEYIAMNELEPFCRTSFFSLCILAGSLRETRRRSADADLLRRIDTDLHAIGAGMKVDLFEYVRRSVYIVEE